MKEMTAQEFVRRLRNLLDGTDNRLIFFLGAGCSISSGIPAAGPLTKDWLIRLKKLQTGNDENFEPWVKDLFADYSDENAALFYGKTIEKLFLTPDERQKEIERLTENRDPGFGYVILAQLLSQGTYGRCCNTILTTNFDDLVADGLYLYNNKKPLVIVHDSLVSFVKVTRTRPLVIKLHGDARLAPRNTETETHELNEAVQRVLKLLLSETGLVFIGYGGNDQSIISVLSSLDDYALPGGVYWVGSKIPDNEMGKWMKKRNAIWVNHRDFDELMLLILDEFELDHPNEERFKRLLGGYFETFKKLETLVKAKPESEEKKVIEEAVEKAAKRFKDWRAVIIEANKYQDSDKEKADEIYKEGLQKFPESGNLATTYAIFLTKICKDNTRAAELFKRASELEPNQTITLGNYALFLDKNGIDYDMAEEFYNKSLEADPNSVNNISNYAIFLHKVRHDYDKAGELYRKAYELDHNHANNICSYAVFLHKVRNDHDKAGELYRKAFEIYPNSALNTANYAGYLLSKGNYVEGNTLLNKALELSDNETILIECLFYQYAHNPDNAQREETLAKMKELIKSGARSPGWNLQDNVKRAIEDGHPHPEFLEILAKVISDEADVTELEKYDEWTNRDKN